ncbi:MAG: hypothetical protein GXP33_12795 [Spirochaetes bacterium]|nr:hypothetical protein [Spirochaetota bacterium]
MNNGNKDFDKGKRFSDSQNKRPPPAPVPPAGPNAPPPPHDPEHLQNERLRARFELDSAYRDLRRGELIVQQIETYLPSTEETSFGRKLLDIASEIYQSAYRNYQKESFFKAAEYSVAVKDLMRGIDKFYNAAGPYPIYPESEENKT